MGYKHKAVQNSGLNGRDAEMVFCNFAISKKRKIIES